MEDKLIFQKIPQIMADVPAITKARKNQQQGYSFRGIDDMYNELHGLFAKHQVFFTSKLLSSVREERQTAKGGLLIYQILDIEFTFYASDGSNIVSVMRGEAMDSGDKASNKAASTALKYALMQLLMIPTEDIKDTEVDSPEPISKEKQEHEVLKGLYNDLLTKDVFNQEELKKYALSPVWSLELLKKAYAKVKALKEERLTQLYNQEA